MLTGEVLASEFVNLKSTSIVLQKRKRKKPTCESIAFSAKYQLTHVPLHLSAHNCMFTAMTLCFLSFTDAKQSIQYTTTTHLSGSPMAQIRGKYELYTS